MNYRYLLKRLGLSALMLYVVVSLSFLMVKLLPGSIEDYLAAQLAQTGVSQEAAANFTSRAGLTGSGFDQYLQYLGLSGGEGLLQGNFGTSSWYNEPVAEIIGGALPWTVLVMSLSTFFIFGIGIGLGAILAYNESSRLDYVVTSVATVLNSIPYYVAAFIFLSFLGYEWGLFPTGGTRPQGVPPGFSLEFVLGVLHYAALPVASFVITGFGFRALAMRGNSIQVLGENYVRVARLRGLSDTTIALRYVGRNAVLPMYTGMLIAVGAMFGGSVVLERIFSYKGMGYYMFQGLSTRDVPLMMGCFIVISTAVVITLTIADLTFSKIDPQARSTSSGTRRSVSLRERLRSTFYRTKNAVRSLGSSRGSAADPVEEPADAEHSGTFTVTADGTLSRRERVRRWVDEFVLAPARIVWSDVRARIGLLIISAYVLFGVVLVRFLPRPSANQSDPLAPPFASLDWSILGTDQIGRDVLLLVVHSTPAILKMILAGALFAGIFATIFGLIAGYASGYVERAMLFVTDTILAIPGLPLAMVLAVLVQPESPYVIGLILSVNAWGGTARQVHSQVLSITSKSYVEASQVMGLPRRTILFKDILPNILPFVFIKTVQMGRRVVFGAVALYFLGLLPVNTLNWGLTMNQAYKGGALYSLEYFHWLFFPALAIIGLTYGLILFAQGTEQVFNPKVRVKHTDETVPMDHD